jgi:hypothetical protein
METFDESTSASDTDLSLAVSEATSFAAGRVMGEDFLERKLVCTSHLESMGYGLIFFLCSGRRFGLRRRRGY